MAHWRRERRSETVALPDRNVIDMSYRVIEAEPARRLVLESQADGFSARTVYEFKPADVRQRAQQLQSRRTLRRSGWPGKSRRRLWPNKYNEHIERSIRRRTTALLDLAGNGGMDV